VVPLKATNYTWLHNAMQEYLSYIFALLTLLGGVLVAANQFSRTHVARQ
jgi:hypothetical protein